MNLNEVLHGKSQTSHPIVIQCSEFLEIAEGLPLLKNLPKTYQNLHKVKMRRRNQKGKDKFAKTFNEAFDEIPNLRQRAMFANGISTFVAEQAEKEPFYVFPINGFNFMYSLEVTNSNTDYMEAFDTILSQFHNNNGLMEQVLKYNYTCENLYEGIIHGSEIILYNMPYCFAVRCDSVDNYETLLQDLENYE